VGADRPRSTAIPAARWRSEINGRSRAPIRRRRPEQHPGAVCRRGDDPVLSGSWWRREPAPRALPPTCRAPTTARAA
jgi:hypothetical protein